MNVVLLRGHLSRPPVRRALRSGTPTVSYEVTVPAVPRAESVPVVWLDPGSGADAFDTGDEVVVVGRVVRRFFRTPAGTQSRTEVVAARVAPAGGRRAERLLLDALRRAEEVVEHGPSLAARRTGGAKMAT